MCFNGLMTTTKPFINCQCFAVLQITGDFTANPIYGPCGAQTQGTFAPGHDAKLKGALLSLIRSGEEYIRVPADGGTPISISPLEALQLRGWERFNKPVTPKAPRKAKVNGNKSHPGFHPVRVKIGRWTYDAVVVSESTNELTVSYTDRKSNKVVCEIKRAQVVEA